MTAGARSVGGDRRSRSAAHCAGPSSSRRWSPAPKLPEDALGERFGVSRTIARHALGQLAAEGLVELRRNRIAVVATPSWQEARDAFDIRIELERLVVRQLAGAVSATRSRR